MLGIKGDKGRQKRRTGGEIDFLEFAAHEEASKNRIPVLPHDAVPEVSKGKVHITQNKHVPIGIDCDFLNTFHSISRATLS